MNTHVVIKRLPGPDGQQIEAGTEVDASEWRNAPLLVRQRYLKPIDAVAHPDGQVVSEPRFDRRVVAAITKEILEGDGELIRLLREKLNFNPDTQPTRAVRKSNQS